MRSIKILLCCLLLVAACSPAGESPDETSSSAVLFEGARLVVGDGGVVENSAFLVDNGQFIQVGAAGSVPLPAGASRVDLTGKTVIPGLIDAHVHLGYADVKAGTNTPANYGRENLTDTLRRLAYYGVAASLSMGLDPQGRNEVAFELRENPPPGTALYRTVGSGIAMPNAGPGAQDRRDAAYGITTEEEARAVVQELAALNVDMVKMWVDDRRGSVQKLTPALWTAVIDEAHNHNIRAVAHVLGLEDAKALIRDGIDGFNHTPQDQPLDDEIMAMLAERPGFFLIPNLPRSGLSQEEDLAYLRETMPAEAVDALVERFVPDPPLRGLEETSEGFQLAARNMVQLHEAGVLVGVGTDSQVADRIIHEEMADMVAAGMTPAEVIEAATSVNAEILGLEDQLGTVADGKSADFVVLDANPLDDIENTLQIDRVYIRGEELDRAGLRAMWTG